MNFLTGDDNEFLFTNEEKEILNTFLSSKQINEIETYGHILPKKRRIRFIARPYVKLFMNEELNSGDKYINTILAQEKPNLLRNFFDNKKGKLLLSSHHIFNDGQYISKILENYGLVNFKHSYPIIIQFPRIGLITGMGIPILGDDEYMILNQNQIFDQRLIASITNKMFSCAKKIVKEGNTVVLFPEGIRRKVATQEKKEIEIKSLKRFKRYFLGIETYAVLIMDNTEEFGNNKKYKEGKRIFDLLEINWENTNLQEELEKHFNLR